MSPNESEHLEFRGQDLKEWEQFIVAVNKHARAQGKLWDDQWIAELVAVSLAEEAATWWSLLDEETQKSWKLLRHAMAARFRLAFHGKTGIEAEDFVYQIRQRAHRAGKLNDPEWTAELASSCFAGTALRWYASLDPSVQGDWASLQHAIFTQYAHDFKEDPTPPITTSAPPKHRYRGRIRVYKKGDSAIYYISKAMNGGTILVTSTLEQALQVEYNLPHTSDALQALTIPDDQIPGFNQLGVKWPSTGSSYSVLCGVDSKTGTESTPSTFGGPLLATPWVSSSTNERGSKSLGVVDESGRPLYPLSYAGQLSYVWFRPTKTTSGEAEVDLFLEAI